MDLCWQIMSLLLTMLSRLVITFLPRSKRLLISWLQSPSVVILEPKIIQSVTTSTVFLSICHEVMGPDAMILVFWMLSFKPTFSLVLFAIAKIWKQPKCPSTDRFKKMWCVCVCVCVWSYMLPKWWSSEESTCQCRRHRFDLRVGKVTWTREWVSTFRKLGSWHLVPSLHGK